eukprot:43600_1
MSSNCALFIIVSIFTLSNAQWSIKNYNPIANTKSIVKTNTARFTVLTDNLIRMEYDPTGTFDDRASTSIINRYLPSPQFTSSTSNNTVKISTKYLTLTYNENGPFSSKNLNIQGNINNIRFNYKPTGDPSLDNSISKNLLGTIKSLDEINGYVPLNCTQNENITIHGESLHCVWAPFGENGYALINDTNTTMIDNNWLSLIPNKNLQDWYFFGHGHSYRKALKEFGLIIGNVPMIPRYALGIMHCKWNDYSDLGIHQIIDNYNQKEIPLDVEIIDMDWHIYGPWGAYTWNTELFSFPNTTQDWLHSKNIRTSANLHDASGIATYEEYYNEACDKLGSEYCTKGKDIVFNVTDKNYMEVLDDIVMGPIGPFNGGFDVWWIDWQQGGRTGMYYSTSNPTILLNYVRTTDSIRNNKNIRGMVLARYGGYGNARYPHGFSGDVAHNWQSLAFEVPFTSTSANVAYAWSHDIRGSGEQFELNTRWVQWGAYSPMFRTHGGAGGGCSNIAPYMEACATPDIWMHPFPYFNIERDFMQQRASLLPYLYNATWNLYINNIHIMRPMYYDYSQLFNSYKCNYQYMYGNNMIISPVTSFSGDFNGFNLTQQNIWIPPNDIWYELHSGSYYNNEDEIINRWFDISEMPIYIKTGAIIAKQPFSKHKLLGRAGNVSYDHIEWNIYPIPNINDYNLQTVLYEDDGISYDYINGSNVLTYFNFTFNSNNNNIFNAQINSKGNYNGFDNKRRYSIRIYNVFTASKVSCNGINIEYNPLYYGFEHDNGYYYDQ